MLPDLSKPILLMEGGPFRDDVTIDPAVLRARVRLLTLFFPRVLISPSDFIESPSLHLVARSDQNLWTTGSIEISLPDDVKSLEEYIDKRVVPGRPAVDRGLGRPVTETRRDAEHAYEKIGEFIPCRSFSIRRTRNLFKENALDILVDVDRPDISDKLCNEEDFYRGLIMKELRSSQPHVIRKAMTAINAHYYWAHALEQGATIALQPRYIEYVEDIYGGVDAVNSREVLELLDRSVLSYLQSLERWCSELLSRLEVNIERLCVIEDQEFAELVRSENADRFRTKLHSLMTLVITGRASASDFADPVEVFNDLVESAIQNESDYLIRETKAKWSISIVAAAIGIPAAIESILAVHLLPYLLYLVAAGSVAGSTIVALTENGPLMRIFERYRPAALTLFSNRLRELGRKKALANKRLKLTR